MIGLLAVRLQIGFSATNVFYLENRKAYGVKRDLMIFVI